LRFTFAACIFSAASSAASDVGDVETVVQTATTRAVRPQDRAIFLDDGPPPEVVARFHRDLGKVPMSPPDIDDIPPSPLATCIAATRDEDALLRQAGDFFVVQVDAVAVEEAFLPDSPETLLVTTCQGTDLLDGAIISWKQEGAEVAPGMIEGSCDTPTPCNVDSIYTLVTRGN
jgi:hypothetical protein